MRCVSGSWHSPISPSGSAPEALKYRRQTNRISCAFPYQPSARSTNSLDSPYGFTGDWGWSSSIGSVCGTPYVAQVEENTTYCIPQSMIACNRLKALATLLWKYLRGCSIDSPTYAFAAKWMTP